MSPFIIRRQDLLSFIIIPNLDYEIVIWIANRLHPYSTLWFISLKQAYSWTYNTYTQKWRQWGTLFSKANFTSVFFASYSYWITLANRKNSTTFSCVTYPLPPFLYNHFFYWNNAQNRTRVVFYSFTVAFRINYLQVL